MRIALFLLLAAAPPSAFWAQNGTPPAPSKQQITGQASTSAATSSQGQKNVQGAPATLSPEDAEILRLKDERQRLLKQKEIEKLRKENEQLEAGGEKPATAQTPPEKALSPEDAQLQRLEKERQRLLKEQEIEKLRKQNEALKAPVPPAQPVQAPTPATPPAQPSASSKPAAAPCTPANASAKAQGGVHVGIGRLLRKPLDTVCAKGGICTASNTGAVVTGAAQTQPCVAPANGQAAK